MKRVLVTDGEQRAALALVRSLGRRGDHVFVTSKTGRSLAGASRSARADVAVPDPATDPVGYADAMEGAVRARGIDVLIPVTELSLRVLLPLRGRLNGTVIPFPSLQSFCRVSDKAWLVDRAAALGVPVPPQVRLESPAVDGAMWAAMERLGFPLVIKPGRSVVQTGSGAQAVAVRYARDVEELRGLLDAMPPAVFPVLVQRRIVGPGVGLFLLVWDGTVHGVFGHRRIREVPPSGGVSTCRESVPADPRLVDLSLRLLRDVEWQGVAMVEFKIDSTTGTPYLIEVNGRFWGSLQLAVDAGVDFPALLMDAVEGRPAPPEPVTLQRRVRTRWFWGEVDHVLAVLRGKGQVDPDDESRRLSRARTLSGVLRWGPGDRTEVLRWSDPHPFAVESVQWFRSVLRRRR